MDLIERAINEPELSTALDDHAETAGTSERRRQP
jgi:hypothetical protein